MRLHELSVRGCVEVIGVEDAGVIEAMRTARPAIAAFIEAAEPGFVAGGRLIYIGAGTSGRLGVLDASECPPTFCTPPERVIGVIAGGDSALRKSSEGKEDDPDGARTEVAALNLTSRDSVLGIAAGGTTPYVLGALAMVKKGQSGGATERRREGPLTALLSCTPVERPAFVDHLIVIETGPEVLTGSTRMKAGTATKLAVNTISTTLMIRSGKVYENLMVEMRATNAKLRDRAARIVSTLTGLSRDESFALLDRAGGSVKQAVVMQRRGVDAAKAEKLLAEAGGRLELALTGS